MKNDLNLFLYSEELSIEISESRRTPQINVIESTTVLTMELHFIILV
jgi:hypothetical protein